MKKFLLFFLIVSCTTKTDDHLKIKGVLAVDEYHGQKIEDPYRNLENLEDSIVIKWLKNHSKHAFGFLSKIPGRQILIDKQKEFDKGSSYNTWGERITQDGQYFYAKKDTGEEKYKIYYRQAFESKEEEIFDPSFFLNNSYQINYFNPDWEGEKLAISLAKTGEEVSKIIVIDIKSKKIISEIIGDCSPSSIGGIQWLKDNSGFIYLHLPVIDPNDPDFWLNTQSMYYNLESKSIHQTKDVFSKKNNPTLDLNAEDFPLIKILSDYDDYVFGEIYGSSSFKDMYYKKYDDLLSNKFWKPLYKQKDKIKKISILNNEIIFLSAKNSPNFKLCRTSLISPDFENPEVLIKENQNSVIDDFRVTKDGIFFVRIKNGVEAKLFFLNNEGEREIILPKPAGRIFISSKGANKSYLRVYIGGWLNDNEVYSYDLLTNSFKDVNLDSNNSSKVFESLVVEEIEIISHDNVKIPLSLIYPKGIKKDKNNRVLFYGYGSYGGGIKPFFSPGLLTWASEGGILAIAHVRGGGEKGDTWHKAGFKTTKPNTWKDMIAVTEYMIKEDYTTPQKSSIWGSSAGGIMAGRAMTERPDLYKAAILTSPALNMLRCEVQPNGLNSIKEFGTVEIKEEFEALLEMDSYHSLKKDVKYPATLVTGGMKDGRVVIWDPAKFVARFQELNTSENPILFAVDFDQGHAGMNSSDLKAYEFYANPIAFAFWQTGHPDYQPN